MSKNLTIKQHPLRGNHYREHYLNIDYLVDYQLWRVIDSACLAQSGNTINWKDTDDIRGEFTDEEELYTKNPDFVQRLEKHQPID